MTTEKTEKEGELTNDIEKLTPQELEILNLQTQLKDLKDLYDNVVKENTAITKLSNEYEAKVLELQSLLIDGNQERDEEIADFKEERDEEIADFKEEIVGLEKDLAVGEAVNEQLEEHLESYLGIIDKLIKHK